jgi:hypothetical protein
MKTMISVIALVFFVNTVSAQKLKSADVPEAVKNGFSKMYPNAKDVDWEKEDANYEAEFETIAVNMDNPKAKAKKRETSVTLDASGNVIEAETEIDVKDLPKAAVDYVAANYAGYELEEAEKMTDSKGTVTYEAELEKGKEEFDLIFDANGAFIKKEDKKEDGDKKEKKK